MLYFYVLFLAYVTFCLTVFNTLPLLPIILDTIKPLNDTRQKIFILNGDFIVDRNENYWKIYAFDFFTCGFSVVATVSIDTMYCNCIQHIVGLFAIVK